MTAFWSLCRRRGIEKIPQLLPCLWYNAGGAEVDVRYVYMDGPAAFCQEFYRAVGRLCRAHQVKLIGHLVEENSMPDWATVRGIISGRLRVMDTAGLDIVCNLYPEQTSGAYYTGFNFFDSDFSHWGCPKWLLPRLASTRRKKGYLRPSAPMAGMRPKVMKWITDVLTVQVVTIWSPMRSHPMNSRTRIVRHIFMHGEKIRSSAI